MTFLKKHKDLFLLNYLLIIIYSIVFMQLKMAIKDNIMFSTIDSGTYWSTGHEFYNFSEKGFSELRTFLYPLILVQIHSIFGIYGIWIMQLFFWIISINLMYLSIKQITNNKILSFIGSLIIALNISYLILTVHALTEASTILLLSILIYFISRNIMKVNTLKFFQGCLLILVLLAVIKPIFYLPVLIMLFIILPVFYFKKHIQNPKSIIKLFLIIIPLLYQITIMKAKYDTFSFTNVSSEGFRMYLFAQGVQHNNNISLDEARKISKSYTSTETFNYFLNNKMVYTKIYLQNLQNAIKSVPCFILYKNSFYQPDLINYMILVNRFYYYIHIIFVIPILLFLYFSFRRKERNYPFFPLICLSFLSYYLLLISAISFGEGDRHVLSSLPIWVFLYSIILNYFFEKEFLKLKLSRGVSS